MTNNQTLDFYNSHADAFIEQTRNVMLYELYDTFISNLPHHLKLPNHILDVGCGSGRDSFWFSNKFGINVTAIDGSSEIIKRNKEYYALSDVRWLNLMFDGIKTQGWDNQFTGIWACASLLHVPFQDLPHLMTDLMNTLIFDGIMYASFKHGTNERTQDGRFFCDMNETRLLEVLHKISINCTLIYDCWLTTDQREDRDDEWLNVLITKRAR